MSTLHEQLLALAETPVRGPETRRLNALIAAIKLHAPDQSWWCNGDDAPWPCSTIRTIAEALGVPLEAENRG